MNVAYSDLPAGWRWVALGDVVVSMKNGIYKPSTSYADDGVACLRMYNIDAGHVVWRDIKRMKLSDVEVRDYGLKPGDLLVNRVNSRELVGKTAVIPEGLETCVFESKNIRVRVQVGLAEPKFVSYRLLSAGTQFFSRNAQQVVGMASISQPQVAAFPLPLPPLTEQRAIVAEIEKQLTRLDAAVAALRRVQGQLKRYRAAVLKAACEGRLVPTEAALARQAGRDYEGGGHLLGHINAERRLVWTGSGGFAEQLGPTVGRINALPDGWVWSTLGQLGFITGGLTKNPKRSRLTNRISYLRVANVYANELRLDDVESIGVAPAELEKLLLRAGDLLIVEGNGSKDQIGRLAVWDGSVDPCVHQNHLIRARLARPEMARWVALTLLSPPGRRFIELVSSSTSGLYTLSVSKVGALPVPVPPLEEQHRIVAEVERRFSVISEMEATVAANLQRAARLRQSILDRAFRGELVRDTTTA